MFPLELAVSEVLISMITLFHLNHGFKTCQPGEIINLLPLDRFAQGDQAKEYAGWIRAFPDGVSAFGLRHITPDHGFGEEVPKWKLEIEWKLEEVRQQLFRNIPSRYQAFFGLATLLEAVAFRARTKVECGIAAPIWETEAEKVYHCGDMRLVSQSFSSEANLRMYWEGQSPDPENAIWECLVKPPVKMVRCVVLEQE